MNTFKYFITALSLTLIQCQQGKNENTTSGNPLVAMAVTSSSSNSTVANHYKPKSLIDLFIPKSFAFPAPSTLLDSSGQSVQLNYNWVNIGQIEFKAQETAESEETDGSDIKFEGPYAIDLFSSSPETLGTNTLSLNQVRRIKIKLIRTTSSVSNAPTGLIGKSIYISGTINGHSFSFSTTDESEIQVSGPSAISPVNNKALLLEIKTADLIRKINLSTITSTTNIDDSNRMSASNPCPSIDSSANDLYTCFRKGLETEANLGRDDNGDFRLDAEEESVK